jgi:hypothetical protein
MTHSYLAQTELSTLDGTFTVEDAADVLANSHNGEPEKATRHENVSRITASINLFAIAMVLNLLSAEANRQRKKKKQRRGILRRIANWWKRRNFYIVQDGSQDESQNGVVDVTMEESFDGEPSHCQDQDWDMTIEDTLATVQTPLAPSYVSAMRAIGAPPGASPFTRNRTKDSFQGSLESIDSLAESHWDPEDDSSQVTPVANNVAQPSDFFSEHVDFLRVQTQPRKVEVVWNK